MTIERGKVYLVGAGPGDPELITVKGLAVIGAADVIVYDNLISKSLLRNAKTGAKLVYAGKSRGIHTMKQSEINDLLVKEAKKGKTVARLKGGDCFIFGRGGEEAEYLADNDVDFEVIPGITAAYSVPAYAGIPLTHRALTSGVAFITGHEQPYKRYSKLDWSKIATAFDTLVFFMGVKNLSVIVERLIANGRHAKTPVAIIMWGTTPKQKTVVGTLSDILKKAEESRIKPPAIIVVGEVVNLEQKLQWFENKPLFGKNILLTRSLEQSRKMAGRIEELGGEPLLFPTIKLVAPESYKPLDDSILRISQNEYDWVIFSSANAVKHLLQRVKHMDFDLRIFGGIKIAAIGKSTSELLSKNNLKADFIPEKFVAESAVDGLKKIIKAGQKALIPRAKVARTVIEDELREFGVDLDVVVAYENVMPDTGEIDDSVIDYLREDAVDYIIFTSSSTVVNFMKMTNEIGLDIKLLKNYKIVSIGPITSKTCTEFGLKVDIEPEEFTASSIIDALIKDTKGERR